MCLCSIGFNEISETVSFVRTKSRYNHRNGFGLVSASARTRGINTSNGMIALSLHVCVCMYVMSVLR